MELWEKVLVNAEFLKTDHGRIACTACHGGNTDATELTKAHEGLVRDRTYPDPAKACAECHGEISGKIQTSLHYTLYP